MTRKPDLYVIQPRKARSDEFAGEELECHKCGNRELIETFRPRVVKGRIVKGKRSSWACPLCRNIVWQ